MDDLISRQAAIEALAKNMPSWTTPDGSGQFDHDIQVTDEAYVDCMQIIHDMPSAQPEPDQNGDIWITVPDIDKVTRIYVQESKSKFCRIFYEERI